MSTFSQVQAGTRARKPIVLPLPGAQVDAATGEWVGPTIPLDVRVIRNDEYDDILTEARKFAVARGIEAPEDGDTLYERGKMIHTLALVCTDRESPNDAPRPFFDGGWEQIHKSDLLTPEVVGYLYLQWELFQEELNPLATDIKPETFLAAAVKTAGGDMAFFVNSRPGTRWIFTRTLALQLVTLLGDSSLSSPSSEPRNSPPTTGA